MPTEEKGPHPKPSLEERIKSNVALCIMGAVVTGFTAGIAAVKWSDERYKVEPIPIAERDSLLKAQSDLVALRRAYTELERQNAELKKAVSTQKAILGSPRNGIAGQLASSTCLGENGELALLKQSYAKSQADLTAALKLCSNAPAVSAAGSPPSELSGISITVNYAARRVADANMISSRLGPGFKDLQLIVCAMGCTRTGQIVYGYDLSAPMAFSVARLLAQAGVTEFSQPMVTRGDGPHRMTIYLSD